MCLAVADMLLYHDVISLFINTNINTRDVSLQSLVHDHRDQY